MGEYTHLNSLKLSSNCSNVCIRPSIFNSLLSADCKPKLNLFTPAALYSESLLSLTVPGLHSIVISASSKTSKQSLTAANISAIQPSGSTDGVPPPKNMDVILSFTCPSAVFLISLISALVLCFSDHSHFLGDQSDYKYQDLSAFMPK